MKKYEGPSCPSTKSGTGWTVYFGPMEIRNFGAAEQVLAYPHPSVKLVNGAGLAKAQFLHRDGLGSVRAITNATGARIEGATYKPYGEQTEVLATQPAPETKGWIGERYDADAGLQYLNARYYDPELGMFAQPDWWEVTKPGVGTNRYAYSFGDPVNKMDPGGNESRKNGIISALTRAFSGKEDDLYDFVKDSVTPRNSKLAGSSHPKTGVKFDKLGYPDFSGHLFKGKNSYGKVITGDVNIGKLTGSRHRDELLANAEAGLEITPAGYTWHHHQDKGRMQLIDSKIHAETQHTGGYAIAAITAAVAEELAAGIAQAEPVDYLEFGVEIAVPDLVGNMFSADPLYGDLDDGFQSYDEATAFYDRLFAAQDKWK